MQDFNRSHFPLVAWSKPVILCAKCLNLYRNKPADQSDASFAAQLLKDSKLVPVSNCYKFDLPSHKHAIKSWDASLLPDHVARFAN